MEGIIWFSKAFVHEKISIFTKYGLEYQIASYL